MQSEVQHSLDSKSPYLSQYKNEISAKQKLIRQRLGNDKPSDDYSSSSLKHEKDNIPPIDDELAEQVSQERRYKSRFSYFDNEAEASLQFFKKNLMPSTGSTSGIATGGSVNRKFNLSSVSKPEPIETKVKIERPRPLSERFDSNFSGSQGKTKTGGATRPLSYKQTSPNEPKNGRPTGKDITQQQRDSYSQRSSSKTSLDRPADRQTSLERSYPREVPNTTKLLDRSTYADGQNYQSEKEPSIDGTRYTASPTQSGTFSRKPLYNSLLRAHDSIRLKVNRPKVRPKSTKLVDDTEIDDSIQLEDINIQSDETNERPVDVKRGSSRRKSKKKESKETKENSVEKAPIRNFSEVRVVRVVRSENERSLGVTVRAEEGNIVVARIMAGSLADKQGALQVGDIILIVNNREVYTPEQLQEQLKKSITDETVILKIVPSYREELPTLCIYLRALFNYDANEDSLLPCKEVGVSFNQGDILEVVNQEDPNWWQARRVDSENLQTGLIPSQELEERRRAFVLPDYDLATRTSICGTKVSRKSKKKEIYNLGLNSDFDKAELQLYEEVCRTPAFERRTLALIGANGVGKQALKMRLLETDPDRFGAPLPHTSRLPRDGEEEGVHYHFVTREKMEEDILDGKYLEFGEYDGALYGTKLDSVREIIGSGKVCILDCSATCLKILKSSDYLPFVAFIAAPTLDQLRYMQDYASGRNRNYTTLDRALSRQSRRAKTLQDFAFDFFEDEDLQLTVEESARLFRVYENYFDIVLVNNNFERTFEQLRESVDALSMAPQWIPISWIYGT